MSAEDPIADIAHHEHKARMLTIGKLNYNLVRGSDVIRDGMYLELSLEGGKTGIAEVFFSYETGDFVLNTFGNDVPLEAIEWIVGKARESLQPED